MQGQEHKRLQELTWILDGLKEEAKTLQAVYEARVRTKDVLPYSLTRRMEETSELLREYYDEQKALQRSLNAKSRALFAEYEKLGEKKEG